MRKRVKKPAWWPFLFLLLAMPLASAAPISSCGLVNESSYLTQDLVFASGTCLTYSSPSAQAITIDCAGHAIRGTSLVTTAFSANPPAPSSLTIKNCQVRDVGKGHMSSGFAGYALANIIFNTTFQNISNTVFWDLNRVAYEIKNVSIVANPSAYIVRFFTGQDQMHAVNSSFLGSRNYLIYDAMSSVEMLNCTLPHPLNIIGELADVDNYFRVMYVPYVKVIFVDGSPAIGVRVNISNSSGHQYYSNILTDSQGKTVRLPLNMSTWYPSSLPFAPFLENSENPYRIDVTGWNKTVTVNVNVNKSSEIRIRFLTLVIPPPPSVAIVNASALNLSAPITTIYFPSKFRWAL